MRRPLFENPYVIDQHRCREYGIRLRITIEVSADREVQDQIERLVENRRAVTLHIVTTDRVVLHTVDEESHAERIPFDGEVVEVTRNRTASQSLLVREGRIPRITGPMNGRARYQRLTALVLHYVELAGARP